MSAGSRLTIIALPHDRCLPVTLSYHTAPLLTLAAAQLFGQEPIGGDDLFPERGSSRQRAHSGR